MGVREGRAHVDLTKDGVHVEFGPWRMTIGWSNVAGAEVSGPYRWWKVIGARLSLKDRGVTFGTNPSHGVCIRLRQPQPALAPTKLLRHPGVTLTVVDPYKVAKVVRRRART